MARFRRNPQPPEGPALTPQWQSVAGGRPEVERAVMQAAIPRQPVPERRRAELDGARREADMQGIMLYLQDDFDGARERFDRSLALAGQWQAAFPGDARAIRAVATQLSRRAMCLTEAEQFAAAIPDGRRALEEFQSLRAGVGTLVPIEMEAAETEAWLALALAGVVAEDPQAAGPDASDAVLRHGTAAMEVCQRLARGSVDALAAAVYAKALDLLNDARDGDYDDAVLAAEEHALQTYRNRAAHLARQGDSLTVQDRRYFAQAAFSHAVGQLHDNPEAARAAAADFIEQSSQLMLVDLPVHPGGDKAQRVWEAGYAEYILAYSELQLNLGSAGQHIANAHYLLSNYPGELPEFAAAAKRELDVIVARWE